MTMKRQKIVPGKLGRDLEKEYQHDANSANVRFNAFFISECNQLSEEWARRRKAREILEQQKKEAEKTD